ncbi:LysR family transcriptional regulator [Rhodospirillaceae bacterium KN72]|uniref:LysR family transcriptional regulator n=1 Tax=Pacificispira spongiicola TaxID=2729598 RepID=A0A7Y0E2N0_9PROT|nr:LysR family transcriptional regulator [Pacificispira spongiicola]NMM46053.1 LysR family transcriptional regulator [Pacificispira spongiicola]
MLKPSDTSLNAVRVFTVVARRGSLAKAAIELGVTPSAVSHQIRKLEDRIETPLFHRTGNTIELTDAGRMLNEESTAAIALIDNAVASLMRDANEIAVQVSTTLAVTWLIPGLERFKRRYPQARISFETSNRADFRLGQMTDVGIVYRRAGHYEGPGIYLAPDNCRPVVSPTLLKKSGYQGLDDIGRIPALKSTEDNWDWRLWAQAQNISEFDLTYSDRFDLDDAAVRAAVAGLGMAMSPNIVAGREIDSGALVPLPGIEPVEMGRYYLLLGPRRHGLVGRFVNWLREEARAYDGPGG